MCLPCSDSFAHCSKCKQDQKTLVVLCEECEEDFNVANNGVGCTECESNEYFSKNMCLSCDSKMSFCRTCIQFPIIDSAPQQCLDCYGKTPTGPKYDEEDGVCKCEVGKFIHYTLEDIDSVDCKNCDLIPKCLECKAQISGDTVKPYCTKCDTGFYIEFGGSRCVRDSCHAVDSAGMCTQCNQPEDLIIQYGKCVSSCDLKHYKEDITGKCVCKDGTYSPDASGTCFTCPAGCKTCNNQGCIEKYGKPG